MNILAIIFAVIAVLFLIILIQHMRFRNSYLSEVRNGFSRIGKIKAEQMTEADIEGLPDQVKKYLSFTGALNREKVVSARFRFEGTLQDKGKPAFSARIEQVSFFDIPVRLFFIRGKMMGLTVNALHKYINSKATFEVKPLSLFHIVDEKDGVLNIAETVTFFNDMCLLAPATLTDKRITWKEIDSDTVEATWTINGITISAVLVFDKNGALLNFITSDRYYLNSNKKMERIRWSTPVSEYKDYGGIRLASKGEAVWSFDDGDFCYARFLLREAEYNTEK